MRLILFIIMTVIFSSCAIKYKGSHTDFKKFSQDIKYCLKKSCINKTNSVLNNISIISNALAYGGGGGSGTGNSSAKLDKISYRIFNLCLNEKGYVKDENGIFELPNLTCN